ncbi:DUF302 domain-containing protein [Sulfurimonas sp.]|uniref:DUF302 domain-containing protein n=1 Tax=Sulfurimonas sp. TaxID=2022749 RepID=UPI003D0C08B7
MRFLSLLMLFFLNLSASDMIIKKSECSVDETVMNIKSIVKKKGLSIFATINHDANAKAVGMELQEAKMVMFGNPKLGTKLMQEDITAGLDLPLRILVYKDSYGEVKMAYRDGSWLAEHHIIKAQQRVAKVNNAMDNITKKAGQCKRD